jgi:hypothetical protein
VVFSRRVYQEQGHSYQQVVWVAILTLFGPATKKTTAIAPGITYDLGPGKCIVRL